MAEKELTITLTRALAFLPASAFAFVSSETVAASTPGTRAAGAMRLPSGIQRCRNSSAWPSGCSVTAPFASNTSGS